MKVAEFLKHRNVVFRVIPHRETYDAQRMAQTLNVSARHVAKTVLLKADAGFLYVLAVLPANKSVDLQRASRMLGGSHLELASEAEIGRHCPDCQLGALPPFGSQYGMRTIMDERLLDDDEIVFETDTHAESVRMRTSDFRVVEQPLFGDFAV